MGNKLSFTAIQNISYIYALVHPKTNKIRYIGKSINPKIRLYSHCINNKKDKKSAWIIKLKKFNLKPKLKILCKCLRKNENKMERYFISKFRNNGYLLLNMRRGGNGWQLTSKPNNYKHLKLIHKKSQKSVTIRNKITKKERNFKSVKSCAKFLKTKSKIISSILNKYKGFNSCKGYFIRFSNETFIEPKYNYKNIKIIAKNIKSNKKIYFKSINKAVKYGFDKRAIKSILNKTRKEFKGFTFIYG